MPESVFFHIKENGGYDLGFNGETIPSMRELTLMKETLERFISDATDEDIEEYNKSLISEQRRIMEAENMRIVKKIIRKFRGFIYLIKLNGKYKIGRAKNPTTRFKFYKTENPEPIEVVLCKEVEDYVKAESKLLKMFKHKQYRGEWHSLDDEDIKKINETL